MEAGNSFNVSLILKNYKYPNGAPMYPALFSIPVADRLPAMAKENMKRTAAIVTVAVTSALETMNLNRPMTAPQIMDLVDAIIETSSEDQLSLEDLVIFLQKMTRGYFGPLYESMDIPKFMEKFEQYREERHQAIRNIRYEKDMQYKSLGDTERTGQVDELSERFSRMADQFSRMKGEVSKLKQENYSLKMDKL